MSCMFLVDNIIHNVLRDECPYKNVNNRSFCKNVFAFFDITAKNSSNDFEIFKFLWDKYFKETLFQSSTVTDMLRSS